jgi:hypothetical protein
MPLSEQEQRLLEEMERSLYHNDADFVASTSARHGRPSYSVVVVGILAGIVGVAVLIAGVVIRQPLVGVLGFIFMFAGVLLAITPPRGGKASAGAAAPDAKTGTGRRGTFMQNLNDRWEKRQEERDE